MNVKSKVWLEKNGELAFGAGKTAILKAIKEAGSINKAAKKMDMSYRHAWSYIHSAERRLGEPLLVKSKGGKDGGGAILTKYAEGLLIKFEQLEQEVKEFADSRFRGIFKDLGDI